MAKLHVAETVGGCNRNSLKVTCSVTGNEVIFGRLKGVIDPVSRDRHAQRSILSLKCVDLDL